MNNYIYISFSFLSLITSCIAEESLYDAPLTQERVRSFVDFVRTMRASPHTQPIPDAMKNAVFESELNSALSKWSEAFNCQSEKGTRLEKLQALGQAKKNMPFVVWGVWETFQNTLDETKRTVAVGDWRGRASFTQDGLDIAAQTEPHFATYVSLIQLILGGEKYAHMRQAQWGVDDELGMGWVNDSKSIVPFSWNKEGASNRTLFLPMPYGERVNDRQRSVLIKGKKFCTQSGFFMQDQLHSHDGRDNSIKYIAHHGEPYFASERITIRQSRNAPFVGWYLNSLIEGGKSKEEADQSLRDGVFFELPTSPEDETLFQAVLLEVMTEVGLPVDEHTSLGVALKSLEARSSEEGPTPPAPDGARELSPPLLDQGTQLYLNALQFEWDERQKDVAQGKIPGRERRHQPKGKQTQHKEEAAEPAIFAPTTEALDHIRQRGRIKYRQVARLIAETLKARRDGVSIKITKVGSHFNLHITDGDKAGGTTLVRLHGKQDRTISANEALSLVGQIHRLLRSIE